MNYQDDEVIQIPAGMKRMLFEGCCDPDEECQKQKIQKDGKRKADAVAQKKVNEASNKRDFGKKYVEKIQPTGDATKDFANTMTALTDDNYEAFVDDLNKLAQDPKLDALKQAIIDNFNKPDANDGKQRFEISFGDADLPIMNIHPTQNEVDMEKSLAFPLKKNPHGMEDAFSGKPVIINKTPIVAARIGKTYYIIDGHHRWSQTYCLNPNASMAAKVIESDMFKTADDILKLVQMQLFIAKNGGKLPQATVDSKYNLYDIDESAFKSWCTKTMTDDAVNVLTSCIQQAFGGFDKVLKEAKDNKQEFIKNKAKCISYLWQNVVIMRNQARPTVTAHGRGDMPQTDQVKGDYIEPVAADVTLKESKRFLMKKQYTRKQIQEAISYWENQLGRMNESYDPLSRLSIKDRQQLDDFISDMAREVVYEQNDLISEDEEENDINKMKAEAYEFISSLKTKEDLEDFIKVCKPKIEQMQRDPHVGSKVKKMLSTIWNVLCMTVKTGLFLIRNIVSISILALVVYVCCKFDVTPMQAIETAYNGAKVVVSAAKKADEGVDKWLEVSDAVGTKVGGAIGTAQGHAENAWHSTKKAGEKAVDTVKGWFK